MKKLINAQQFESTFCSQWEEDKHSREAKIKTACENDNCWTTFMLGAKGRDGQDAFFYRILQKLKKEHIDFSREWYTLDAIYHRRESVYKKDYPPCLDVLIEHENANNIEKEMWKLLMFRSPLKVLVCYNWKGLTNKHCKLDKLADMARRIDEGWNEAEDTEYLIVIGNQGSDNIIIWKFKKFAKDDYKWINSS